MRAIIVIFAGFFYCLNANAADRGDARTRAAAVNPAASQSRSAVVSRSAATSQSVISRSAAKPQKTVSARTQPVNQIQTVPSKNIVSRAAINTDVSVLGGDYGTCRDAYFSCMDQFCATKDDQYRRCECSSRLNQMREKERNFSAATGMLQTFSDNNIAVATKSGTEVKVMYSETEGEKAVKKDDTNSAKALSGISDVLSSKKSTDTASSMSNMTNIWGTTDLVGGADIANLESTALYNAVHAQCSEMVGGSCGKVSTFNMVVAAYGMYIEQDCTAYADGLDKKQRAMITATKDAANALSDARLENYNNHNSDEISKCLENVRNDMFGDGACGKDNVKCVDITGRFINITTGEAIYTPDFYMLENAISLAGDTIKNSINAMYVNVLNNKKIAANKSLDKCRDVSDQVWDEYLRQTLVDLSQKQQDKVREVQGNCVSVVNQCYDEKLEQLKQFASDLSQETVGSQQIGLTEELCKSKLDTCAILYGGGPPGLEKLLNYVRNSQTVKLENNCEKYLTDYITETCSPINDPLHGFPYNCRFYEPGSWDDVLFSDTLYGKLETKAMDVCTRQGAEFPTPEVAMVINKIMDDLKFKMDNTLQSECKALDTTNAIWHTRTLGDWTMPSYITPSDPEYQDYIQWDTYKNKVGANDSWGICILP